MQPSNPYTEIKLGESSDFGDPSEVGTSSDHLLVERMDFAGSRFVRCRIKVVGEVTSNQILRFRLTTAQKTVSRDGRQCGLVYSFSHLSSPTPGYCNTGPG
jgi:hypothetical protein